MKLLLNLLRLLEKQYCIVIHRLNYLVILNESFRFIKIVFETLCGTLQNAVLDDQDISVRLKMEGRKEMLEGKRLFLQTLQFTTLFYAKLTRIEISCITHQLFEAYFVHCEKYIVGIHYIF